MAKLWQNLDLVNWIYLFAPFFLLTACVSPGLRKQFNSLPVKNEMTAATWVNFHINQAWSGLDQRPYVPGGPEFKHQPLISREEKVYVSLQGKLQSLRPR